VAYYLPYHVGVGESMCSNNCHSVFLNIVAVLCLALAIPSGSSMGDVQALTWSDLQRNRPDKQKPELVVIYSSSVAVVCLRSK